MVEPFPPVPKEQFAPPLFRFAGWEFADRTDPKYPLVGSLLSAHLLHNPESPDLVYAYKGYKVGSPHSGREYAAAWLIAHWWEHYLHSCACLLDDHKPSAFRHALRDTLLFMEGVAG
jgi:hypothetical protein